MVCDRAAAWRRRCCRCHGDCTGCFRYRHYNCCFMEKSTAFPEKGTAHFPENNVFRSGTLRLFHLSATICYELWYPDDPGTGKQLRYCDHGSLCRRGQNRYAGIHAGTGIWQCLLPVYLTESRCQTSGSGNRRNPHCGSRVDSFLCDHFRCCLDLCPSADADLCGCGRNDDHCGRCTLSAY